MSDKKKKYLEKAMSWLSSKSYSELKSIGEAHEDPKCFSNKRTGDTVQPSMSFRSKRGGRSYLDIALKTDKVQSLVTKWKLLSTWAKMKSGQLYLLAPKGHKMFTKRLVKKYDLDAKVVSA
ncbi:hypothetical protein [Portibacter marinus]|uniref:hypothetical protein n=1 Tax=Portibacter marinus TaxID=2898660 RepID=UPI001F224679|nr:hypothetical protein [Portibacter marinus]